MSNLYRSPKTGNPILKKGNFYISENSLERFPITNDIPRFCKVLNYTNNFGYQWNKFSKTQLDSQIKYKFTEKRFYKTTNWDPKEISNKKVLEVGSGAGRFTEVFLSTTDGILHSIDYSNAVEANLKNNYRNKDRLILSQASIYEMPYADNTFDKIFCLGVLQHTPSFKKSLYELIKKVKIGGEIVVDFYPIKGWYTKIHSKYIFRPITKRLPHKILIKLIESNVSWMIKLFDYLCSNNLKVLTRFIPITDITNFPKDLTLCQRREWAIMDTFDGFSPEHDNPMRINDVKKLFIKMGCNVNFAGMIEFDTNQSSAVVKAIKL